MKKQNRHIKIKAAVLILVFSMNTLLGFACSLGFKMGYNNHHHSEETAVVTSNHHAHEKATEKHHQEQKQSDSDDDCCSHGVSTFNLLDKHVPYPVTLVHPIFATAFIATFLQPGLLPKLFIPKNIRAFAQCYHPPIPDIRVAIQSFQI